MIIGILKHIKVAGENIEKSLVFDYYQQYQ